jgi:hypothetical protein
VPRIAVTLARGSLDSIMFVKGGRAPRRSAVDRISFRTPGSAHRIVGKLHASILWGATSAIRERIVAAISETVSGKLLKDRAALLRRQAKPWTA